jgi:hypothetical protein
MLCLAALNIAFKHHTGKDRIALWGNFANRTHRNTEHLIGWLATSHVLGFDLSHDPTVFTLLEGVRETVLDGQANQELPLAVLWSSLFRNLSEGFSLPWPDVWFDVQASSESETQATKGLETHLTRRGAPGNAPLYFELHDGKKVLTLVARYSGAMFRRSDIARFLAGLQETLELMAAAPETRVSGFGPIIDRHHAARALHTAVS